MSPAKKPCWLPLLCHTAFEEVDSAVSSAQLADLVRQTLRDKFCQLCKANKISLEDVEANLKRI
jgi:hypothetical protein